MYVPSTNLQGPHSIPQFQVLLYGAFISVWRVSSNFLISASCFSLSFLGILIKEKMSKM